MSTITEQIGRELAGRYRLEAGLGTGASAHVYAAFDASLRRRVAVKLLHPGLSGDAAFLRRFSAEAQAVAALNHPNVLRVFDWGEEEDGPFLVLEYLGGGSLRDLLDQGARLSPAQAATVGMQAARGLAYAHRRGLVHRDVKPANLLFDEDGGVRIADFGLARALAEAAWTEPAGAVLGTARYASPEQAQGHPLDHRSDVYSLALVLYEAVTGRVPFGGETTFATLMARVGAVLPPAPELGPLSPILAQAAIAEPLVRLDTEELAEDLELLVRALPPAAPLPLAPPAAELPPEVDRRRSSRPARPARERVAEAIRPDPPAPPPPSTGRPPARPGPSGDLTELGLGPSAPEETAPEETALLEDAALAWSAVEPPVEGLPGDEPVGVDEDEPEEELWLPEGAARRAPSRRRRRWLAALVVVLLVALAGGGYAYRRATAEVQVPSVTGASLSSAEASLRHLGLLAGSVTSSFSSTVPSGEVLGEHPGAGVKEKAGTRVSLVVSRGHAPVAVPPLAGRTQAVASSLLTSEHLVPSFQQAYNETVPAGEVVASSPSGGSAAYGSTVTVQVSEGPHPRQIPQFASSTTWAEASAALTKERLVPAEQQAYSNEVPAGSIISTSPAEGAGGVAVGTKVTVVVSLGPQLVAVPSVSGDTVSQAVAALEGAGLEVTEQVGPPFATQASTTDPAPGTKVRPGTAVTLYVS